MSNFQKFVLAMADHYGVSHEFKSKNEALIYERVPGLGKTEGWHQFYKLTDAGIEVTQRGVRGKRLLKFEGKVPA